MNESFYNSSYYSTFYIIFVIFNDDGAFAFSQSQNHQLHCK